MGWDSGKGSLEVGVLVRPDYLTDSDGHALNDLALFPRDILCTFPVGKVDVYNESYL